MRRTHSPPSHAPKPLPPELDGSPRILSQGEHPVHADQIEPAILGIVNRLRGAGFLALLVGGAVRDLLLGRTPKDFDLVSSARPEEIKRLFPRARIIGRRFRLVLLRVGDREIEVSTFRAQPRAERGGRPASRQAPRGRMIERDNVYGTPGEDAFRRDFSVNALAFDPRSFSVIDYVGGLDDLQRGVIRTIGAPEASFLEDPVRMLRAIRFKVRLGFTLHPAVEAAILRMAPQLEQATRHRLAEETQRFLCAGQAEAVFAEFKRKGLLGPLLGLEPHRRHFDRAALDDPYVLLLPYLRGLDTWMGAGGDPIPPTVALLGLLITLSRPELKRDFLGEFDPVSPQRETVRELNRHAPAMMGDWGLLKGQVLPALEILRIARRLLRLGREGTPADSLGERLGLREAWWLLILLRDVLGLDEPFLAPGRKALPGLRPLPILDHHQPWRSGKPAPGGSAKHADQPGAKRRRRRRRGRGKRGHGATADAE